MQSIVDALKTEFVGVIALAAGEGSRVVLIANVSDSLTDRIQAGKIIQTIAPIAVSYTHLRAHETGRNLV